MEEIYKILEEFVAAIETWEKTTDAAYLDIIRAKADDLRHRLRNDGRDIKLTADQMLSILDYLL